jgi:hypothetical protein
MAESLKNNKNISIFELVLKYNINILLIKLYLYIKKLDIIKILQIKLL